MAPIRSYTRSAAAHRLRSCLLGAALVLGAPAFVALTSLPAAAQSVFTAVLVNDVPISNYDIDARAALLRLQGATSGQARARAEDELIDEALQRAEARRVGISVSQAELDQTMQSVAQRSGLSVSQLGQALSQRGVDIASLRSSIESQILWEQVIRARFQATVRVDEQDVLAALGDRPAEDGAPELTTTEYTLREVIFIVEDGASNGERERRRQEANALRSRFETCASGIQSARQLSGVVVGEETRRFSADLLPAMVTTLDETAIGRLTEPQADADGLVMLAICNKREVRSDAEARRDVESELRSQEGQLLSRGYLRDLRASATIIRPN